MSSDPEAVLVWTTAPRDSLLAVRMLRRHGLQADEITTVDELLAGIGTAGAAIITSERLTRPVRDALATALAKQPPWSDFPIVLFAPNGVTVAGHGLGEATALGNISILERPVSSGTLITAVLAALRARRRQYEAREAIRGRDQFLAMLGHELRNPLAAIVLALETETAPPSKQHAIIERQAHHLTRLVDDLLDVARVTSGKVRVEKVPVSLTDTVRRCVQSVEPLARSRSMEVTFTAPDEEITVLGDLVRLEEVFNNLLSNAIKYSPDRSRIAVSVTCDTKTCSVEVGDDGIGIAPEMLARVFDLFAQVEGSLARSEGGLGIGLTLVKSLVELHGGTISARSPGLGSGSTFRVQLPRTTSPVLAPSPAPVLETRPLRVVVVEDNLDLLELTRDFLETCGCEVATAPDGTSGLELLLEKQPDIAFVDIGLPGIDGFVIAREARARHLDRTYLVAMSGYGQPEDQRRALDAGFDRHLTKPVTFSTLRDAMSTAVRPR